MLIRSLIRSTASRMVAAVAWAAMRLAAAEKGLAAVWVEQDYLAERDHVVRDRRH
jgi:hypothetical protein